MAASTTTLPASPQFRVVCAPNGYEREGKAVFLAGTIDKGTPNWRDTVVESLSRLPITILNPLRRDWDHTWIDDISFQPFREQTTWEIDMFEASDVIAMYMGPETPAPITLLELGLFARSGKMIVACPKGFYRRGNVQVVCKRFGIDLVDTIEELIIGIERKLEM